MDANSLVVLVAGFAIHCIFTYAIIKLVAIGKPLMNTHNVDFIVEEIKQPSTTESHIQETL